MGEKGAVGGGGVDVVQVVIDFFGDGAAADALVGKRVCGAVVDAEAGRGVRFEDPGWCEGGEVALWGGVSAEGWGGRRKRKGKKKSHCSRMSRTSSRGRTFFTQR